MCGVTIRGSMKIVVRPQGQKWQVVESALYGEEAELQKLLEQSPDLIPMADLHPTAADVQMVISELPIPGSGYLDLLGFTAAGTLVLMECKLRSNPEVKRKVIGQLFEYAGFLWNIPFAQLDSIVRQKKGRGILELMGDAVQKDWNPDSFQKAVEQNLATGTFVLAIVVDRATDEPQRAALFITACGKANYSFHVVEMQRFRAGDVEILTPQVHGTIAATLPAGAAAGTVPRKGRLSKEQFLEEVRKRSPHLMPTAEDLYGWAEAEADSLGTGGSSFAFRVVNKEGRGTSILWFYPDGRVEFAVTSIRDAAEEAVLHRFLKALQELPSFGALPAERKYPNVWLQQPLGDVELVKFKKAVMDLKSSLQSDQHSGDSYSLEEHKDAPNGC